VIRGPIIHLRGANDPNCPGCADFFGYKLNAFAIRTPLADVNLDGTVDAADYVLWRKSAGSNPGSGGSASDPGDYDAWRTYFGDIMDLSAFDDSDFATAAAAPEPASIMLLASCIAFAFTIRRR
jgi:hypothetical protein